MGLIIIPAFVVLYFVGQAIGSHLTKSRTQEFKEFELKKKLVIKFVLLVVAVPIAIGIFSVANVHFPNGATGFPTSYSGFIFFSSPLILGVLVAMCKSGLVAVANAFNK